MANEFGGFSDNASLVAVAARAIEHGMAAEALPVLRELRDRMQDSKSRRWLLPEVNRLIAVAEQRGVRYRVPLLRRRRRNRRRSVIARLEPILVRIAALASLSATIIRIVIHEVVSVLTPRQ